MIKKIICIRKTSIVRSGGRKFRFIVYLIIKKNNLFGLGIGKSYDIHKAINKSYLNSLTKLRKLYNSSSIIGRTLLYKVGKTIIKLYFPLFNVGFIVGGYSRLILEFVGLFNVYGSILGSKNVYNVIIATYFSLII